MCQGIFQKQWGKRPKVPTFEQPKTPKTDTKRRRQRAKRRGKNRAAYEARAAIITARDERETPTVMYQQYSKRRHRSSDIARTVSRVPVAPVLPLVCRSSSTIACPRWKPLQRPLPSPIEPIPQLVLLPALPYIPGITNPPETNSTADTAATSQCTEANVPANTDPRNAKGVCPACGMTNHKTTRSTKCLMHTTSQTQTVQGLLASLL
jgi:predicted RNA-binding Zn-ribbon protein involved in translation (DUF1610 family)